MTRENKAGFSTIEDQSVIRVHSQLPEYSGMSRNTQGHGVEMIPNIKMVVEFHGKWKEPAELRRELDLCIKQLLGTCEDELRGYK